MGVNVSLGTALVVISADGGEPPLTDNDAILTGVGMGPQKQSK